MIQIPYIIGLTFNLRKHKKHTHPWIRHYKEDDLANLRLALLILHSPIDETVSIEIAARLFSIAKHPKSFVSLNKADHLLRRGDILNMRPALSPPGSIYMFYKFMRLMCSKIRKLS